MAKRSTVYVCQTCGSATSKWVGKCEACGAWNSIVEETVSAGIGGVVGQKGRPMRKGRVVPLVALSGAVDSAPRIETGIAELDRVTGGGFVRGSALLVGGDPGIGKSTLLIQAAATLARRGARVVYVSGEEAVGQVRLRAERLGLSDAAVSLAAETSVEDILTTLAEGPAPDLVVIDSIQTLWTEVVDSAPGTVAQVRTAAQALIRYAKESGATVVLVGHVTKEGTIAGPRVVEHMVDAVLYFEGDGARHFRVLRAVKNRFGPTDEIGVFEMTGGGLREVPNPSALFMGARDASSPGAAVFAGMEGTRPVLVEVQALVAASSLGTPRRAVVGWDGKPPVDDPRRAGSPLRRPVRPARRLPERRGRPQDRRTRGGSRRGGRAGLLARRCCPRCRLRLFRRGQPVRRRAARGPRRIPPEGSRETRFHAGRRAAERNRRRSRPALTVGTVEQLVDLVARIASGRSVGTGEPRRALRA